MSDVRIAEADTSAVSDVSDADYESAAEATDHDVSFDGEIYIYIVIIFFNPILILRGKTFKSNFRHFDSRSTPQH